MTERAQKSLDRGLGRASPSSPRLPQVTQEQLPPLSGLQDSRSPPGSRSPSMHLSALPSPNINHHRHSFSEHLRGLPASPRATRQFSISSIGVQDLINNPPKSGNEDAAFKGRDWHDIAVGELVHAHDVRFIELDTGIEEASNVSKSYLNANVHISYMC